MWNRWKILNANQHTRVEIVRHVSFRFVLKYVQGIVCYIANVLTLESFQAAISVDKPKTVHKLFNTHIAGDLQWPQVTVLAIVCSFMSFKNRSQISPLAYTLNIAITIYG